MKNVGICMTVSSTEKKKIEKSTLIDLLSTTLNAVNRFKCLFLSVFQREKKIHSPGNRKPTTAPDNANKINMKIMLNTLINIDLTLLSSGTVLSMGHVSLQSTHAQCVEF